ncbi:MAG TPA: TIGR02147 family protein [bacterium]|nr:TIGR02147 family protein [bacterium]
MRKLSPVNVFEYTDYRAFLRDWYEAAKKSGGTLSYRSFAQRAGLKSINFYKFVMDGVRNLTSDSAAKFALGLKLNKQETEFFKKLVLYTQAKTHDEKNRRYQDLLRSRKYSQLKPIERDQYEYYATWYHPVVRELVVSKDFDGTFEWIAGRLSPAITPAQAEKSVELLEKLGFIERTEEGHWRQASSIVSTGAELKSHVVHNYHKIVLDLTKQVIDELPVDRRDVSTMTLGVNRGRVPELKRLIQNFRQEILRAVASDTEPEEVLQLNIQMFPLTISVSPQQEVR